MLSKNHFQVQLGRNYCTVQFVPICQPANSLLPWYHDKIKYDPSKSKRYTEDLPQLDEDPLLEAASELSGTELAGASLTEQLELLENLRNESPEVFTSDLEMTDNSYEGYRHFCSLPGRLYPLTGSKTYHRKTAIYYFRTKKRARSEAA